MPTPSMPPALLVKQKPLRDLVKSRFADGVLDAWASLGRPDAARCFHTIIRIANINNRTKLRTRQMVVRYRPISIGIPLGTSGSRGIGASPRLGPLMLPHDNLLSQNI